MTDLDRPEFTAKLAGLMELHGLKEPTESLFDSYWSALRDLPFPNFIHGVERALRESRFFPKPAELRDFAGAGPNQRKREAAQAWEQVEWAMYKYDYVHSVDFGHLVNGIIRNMGGWLRLCNRSVPELVWERKRFEEMYELFSGARSGVRGAPLLGAFGGEAVRIPIGGRMPARQLPEKRDQTALALVRELADAKAAK